MLLQIQAQAEVELRKRRASGAVVWDRFQHKYFNDPAAFVVDCVQFPSGDEPAPYQLETLAAIPEHKRVSVRGPHGLGKTALAAWAVLWFALTRDGLDWKIPTLASAWRQVTKYLWPEIRLWSRRLNWSKIGRLPLSERSELLALNLKLKTGEAFGLASDVPELIEGAHGAQLLYLFDESKVIKSETWDAAEGAFASGDVYWLAISTPGETNGRFYEIHKRKPGLEDWWVRHVKVNEAIAAGRINESWVKQRAKQWGVKSAVYQNRVEGEFATASQDSTIPLAHIEKANERWLHWSESGKPGEFVNVGVDVGRGGDESVYASQFDDSKESKNEHESTGYIAIDELRRSTEKDTMPVVGRTAGILNRFNGFAVVDVIGIGAGVFDRLSEMQDEESGEFLYDAIPFNASGKTKLRDKSGELGFFNKRSAAWWTIRELLENDEIALPPDDKLTGELTAPKYRIMSGGKILVESKEDVKKRIGRSTDSADAVIMSLFYRSQSLLLFEV